ncbi:MAG TPA: alpha/beta fold hydrolase [Usitatibacter sp.]|nr:alpha/beta fold hydrolase [Usitatibacter sp.]
MQFIVEGYPAYAYTGGRPFAPSREAVVLVHGAAFDHSVWQWQSRYLAHHGHAVLALDLPAHGRSPGAIRTTIEALAQWLVAFLDAAGVEKAALVGHSMGSLVTLQAALARPARVSRLALVGTSVPMPVGDAFLAAARDDSPAAFDMETVWGHARSAVLASSPVPGVSLLGASRQLNGHSRRGVLAADLAACQAYRPSNESLAALAMPVLVVAGKRDQMTPWKAGKSVAERIPGARFACLDAGHSMMSEAPRPLLFALRDFLSGG